MIGQVFRHYLQSYSHWAFGDVDVVYGRLSHFLTPQVLEHDVITFRTDDLCYPMTKTVWAGQLSVFANNNWTRTLYRASAAWSRIALDPRFLFFDERLLPFEVLQVAPARVALVVGQLTDRKAGRRPVPAHLERRMLWLADSGRLVLSQSHGTAGSRRTHCIESEFAVVHLNVYKFKHFAATISAASARAFSYSVSAGIVPLTNTALPKDPEALAIVESLARGERLPTCERVLPHRGGISSATYEGVMPQ